MIFVFICYQNQSKPIEMMYQEDEIPFRNIPEEKLQVLELPYVQNELSMLILLPEETQDGSDPLLKVSKPRCYELVWCYVLYVKHN